jgi:hypothetical protein
MMVTVVEEGVVSTDRNSARRVPVVWQCDIYRVRMGISQRRRVGHGVCPDEHRLTKGYQRASRCRHY